MKEKYTEYKAAHADYKAAHEEAVHAQSEEAHAKAVVAEDKATVAEDKAVAADKALAKKVAAEKAVADKVAADKAHADTVLANEAAAEKLAAEGTTPEAALLVACREPKTVTLGANERVILTVAFCDDFGNKAPLKDVPFWASTNPQIVTCIPNPDGMSCDCRPGGVMGTATVTATATGDDRIVAKVAVTVVAGLATKGTIILRESEKWTHSR